MEGVPGFCAGQHWALAEANRLHTYLWLSAQARMSDCTEEFSLRHWHHQFTMAHSYMHLFGSR